MFESFVTVHFIDGSKVTGCIEHNSQYSTVEEADILTIGGKPIYEARPGFYTLIPMQSVMHMQLDYE